MVAAAPVTLKAGDVLCMPIGTIDATGKVGSTSQHSTTRCGFFFPCRQGAGGGFFDEVSDSLRLRHIHGVAAFDLDNR